MAKKKVVIFAALGIVIIALAAFLIFFFREKKPVSAVMEMKGAKIQNKDLNVMVPEGALPVGTKIETKEVAKKPALEKEKRYASPVYEITADKKLDKEIVIEIAYNPSKIPDAKIDNLYAAYFENNKWVPADGFIDKKRNVLVVQTNHLSSWAAIWDSVKSLWENNAEPVLWGDIPEELKEMVMDDLGINDPKDIAAVEHIQFSSASKLATFILGVANQINVVSGILSGTSETSELVQAIVEKLGGDFLKASGRPGEITVKIYEAGKTGWAAGTILTETVFKVGVGAAELQNSAAQIASWILDKEMEYINSNTSSLVEYLCFYESSPESGKVDSYIFWYSKKIENGLEERGVILYHWSPSYKEWLKGKNITATSEVFLKFIGEAKPEQEQEGPPLPPPTSETPAPAPVSQSGIIEGSLNYPSEGIPSDMTICAKHIYLGTKYCTSDHISNQKYTYSVGYKLEVPPGEYFVYALTSSLPNYEAYYSEFIVCGQRASCSSHKPVAVKVEKGKTISSIDPGDWYIF